MENVYMTSVTKKPGSFPEICHVKLSWKLFFDKLETFHGNSGSYWEVVLLTWAFSII